MNKIQQHFSFDILRYITKYLQEYCQQWYECNYVYKCSCNDKNGTLFLKSSNLLFKESMLKKQLMLH